MVGVMMMAYRLVGGRGGRFIQLGVSRKEKGKKLPNAPRLTLLDSNRSGSRNQGHGDTSTVLFHP